MSKCFSEVHQIGEYMVLSSALSKFFYISDMLLRLETNATGVEH